MPLPKGRVRDPIEEATDEVVEETLEEETVTEEAEEAEEAGEDGPEDSAIPFDADEEFAEAEEPVEVPTPTSSTTAVAPTTGGAVSAPPAGGSFNALGKLADEGFHGLTVGPGAFPQITLQNEGEFHSSEGWEMGTEFLCQVMGSREKYIVKNTKCEQRDEDFVYTYDQKTNVNSGEPIERTLKEWADNGWGYEVKPYLEVSAMLLDGDHEGELVLLSIPPSGISRFSGYCVRLEFKGKNPADVVTRVFVGGKVDRGKGKQSFYPWAFAEAK